MRLFLSTSVFLIWVISCISVIYGLVVAAVKALFKKNKFNYKTAYTMFDAKDKIKITFMDKGTEVTKKARIISINDKKISFEDKNGVYECVPSAIKRIREINSNLFIFILMSSLLAIMIFVEYWDDWFFDETTLEAAESWYGVVIDDSGDS